MLSDKEIKETLARGETVLMGGKKITSIEQIVKPSMPPSSTDDETKIGWLVSEVAQIKQNQSDVGKQIERITSTKIPVGILTLDKHLAADQQRTVFQFTEPSVVTLAPAKDYYERRTVLANAGFAVGLIEQTFIRITRDGANVINNPVLRPGESLEFIGVFLINERGGEGAPADLEINGAPADDGVKGFYALMIINFDFMGVTWEEFEARTGDVADLVLYFENKLE